MVSVLVHNIFNVRFSMHLHVQIWVVHCRACTLVFRNMAVVQKVINPVMCLSYSRRVIYVSLKNKCIICKQYSTVRMHSCIASRVHVIIIIILST